MVPIIANQCKKLKNNARGVGEISHQPNNQPNNPLLMSASWSISIITIINHGFLIGVFLTKGLWNILNSQND